MPSRRGSERAPRGVLSHPRGRRGVCRRALQLHKACQTPGGWRGGRTSSGLPTAGVPRLRCQPRAAAGLLPGLRLRALPFPVWLVRQSLMKHTFKGQPQPAAVRVPPTPLPASPTRPAGAVRLRLPGLLGTLCAAPLPPRPAAPADRGADGPPACSSRASCARSALRLCLPTQQLPLNWGQRARPGSVPGPPKAYRFLTAARVVRTLLIVHLLQMGRPRQCG